MTKQKHRPIEHWTYRLDIFSHDAMRFVALGEPDQAYWSARFAARVASIIERELRFQ